MATWWKLKLQSREMGLNTNYGFAKPPCSPGLRRSKGMTLVVLDPGSKALDHRTLIWDFVFLWVDVAK